MKELIGKISERQGTFVGRGVNHDKEEFTGTLTLQPVLGGKAIELTFIAVGTDSTVYHEEKSMIAFNPNESICLWVMSSNHPGMTRHDYHESSSSVDDETHLSFRLGDLADRSNFREEIVLRLWRNREVSYDYLWGLPDGDLQKRSGLRMQPIETIPVREAPITKSKEGASPEGEGWFVLNAKDAKWFENEKFGKYCRFNGDVPFDEYGLHIDVLEPGQPNCHYHAEENQEDFLVLDGECLALVEGNEVKLRKWDFVHFPRWTRHVFVGSGDKPCTLLAIGSSRGKGIVYPLAEVAIKHNASSPEETHLPSESYREVPNSKPSVCAIT